MNFFEQQDLARRNTKKLVILLCAAVLSLILMTTLLFAVVLNFFGNTSYQNDGSTQGFWNSLFNNVSWELLFLVTAVVIVVVTLGSLYKVMQLSGGGKAVAEAMGGKLISINANDADEKKILNIVEEMAIASGTPVPPVYIIEEDAINAFAAGHTPHDAVIGITRGCIRLLNRDELQGVVAHEFSHIFHGDMRLNINLVALLNGILLIGLIGYFLLRGSGTRGVYRSSRNKSASAIIAIGVGLMVIGYGGTFFGNIIKSAVSRQREFLADASAVQFTRNPAGISGALKKIGGYVSGSKLESVNAAEFSHMYFSQGVSTAFSALMATHPPLGERIKRVEPRWDGKFPDIKITLTDTNPAKDTARNSSSAFAGNAAQISVDIDASIDSIGQPTTSHLDYAQQTLTTIGQELRDAAHDPFTARALIYGLLLDRNAGLRERQWELLRTETSAHEVSALKKIALSVLQLHERTRLPLLELALPALKQLSPEQYEIFKRSLNALIHADKKVNLLEWALHRIVLHHMEGHTPIKREKELRELRGECQLLLSVLAYAGAKSSQDAANAFQSAANTLRLSSLSLMPKNAVKIALLDDALNQLNLVKALQKPQLLKAMSQCILHDGEVTTAEAELFRAMADGLDCPIPPLLPK